MSTEPCAPGIEVPRLTAKTFVALVAFLLSSSSFPGFAEDAQPVRIGVLAKRGTERCSEKWGPTAEYLTAEIPGCSFTIRPLDYDEVVPAVERGEVDFVLANPSLYVEMERLHGASRIVTLKNLRLGKAYTTYAGVIFCKADHKDVRHLADLNGKRFAAVEAWSFGGWQMAWRELKDHGIDPGRDFSDFRFLGTHDAVVYAVLKGNADGGTVRTDTLERMETEGKISPRDLRVIHEHRGGDVHLPFLHSTRAYPEWPLAKASHTSDELAQKVAVALMRLSPESPAAKAARCAGWVIPQNYEPVHACLQELHIGPYRDHGQMTLSAVLRKYWPWLAGALMLLVVACAVSIYVTRLNRRLRDALMDNKIESAARIRTQKALRESEQLRAGTEKLAAVGRLAAGVAHEINNPLTGVLTFAHLLRQKENMDEQDQEDLDLIVHETTRASEIVRGLLDFARERPPVKEPLSLNDAIQRVMRLLSSQKVSQQITVEQHFADDLPRIEGDVNQLQQVLLNLSLNAFEAMPDGGTLTIGTWAQHGNVMVEVADTGCGITAENLDRIFDPFFSTKPVGKGTGLGLSISYGIVQQHGGTLQVESRTGQGTTFTIALPCTPNGDLDHDGEKAKG